MSETYVLLENTPYKSKYSGEDIDGFVSGLEEIKTIIGSYNTNETRTIKAYLEDLQNTLGYWYNIDASTQVKPKLEEVYNSVSALTKTIGAYTNANEMRTIKAFLEDLDKKISELETMEERIGEGIEGETLTSSIKDLRNDVSSIIDNQLPRITELETIVEGLGSGDADAIGKNLTSWGLDSSNEDLQTILSEQETIPKYILSLDSSINNKYQQLKNQITSNRNSITALNKLFNIQVIDYYETEIGNTN